MPDDSSKGSTGALNREPLGDWLESWGGDFDVGGERWMDVLRQAERPVLLGRIGDYELEREVARGGQGVVFRAIQPGTKRPIALKRMLAGAFATQSMRRRFEREIEAVALLQHPNIVTVYGMDVVDGTPLLAMEWIDGVPATEWSVGRSPEEVLELFLRICDAMQHAHSRGVLHRDIKPSNVLIDERGQPHVLDFGLAKRCPLGINEDADDMGASKSVEALGTPAYASPEQLTGDSVRLGPQTDVYSLAVLLFEMLTGASPYGQWGSIAELLGRVGHTRAPRLASFDPRLGADLDTVLRAALAPECDERTASVEEFAGDIRRYLARTPIHAVPVSSFALLGRLVARNRLVTVLAVSLFLLSLGFGAYSTIQARLLTEQKALAEAARDEALDRERRAASLAAFIPDCMYGADGILAPALAKPGTVFDRSAAQSSPNPYYARPDNLSE